MIIKEEFIKIISKLQDDTDFYYELSLLCSKNRNDSINILPKSFDVALDLLEKLCNDTHHTISWWIYDKNFGRDKEARIFTEKGYEIPLNTVEQLYDYLIGK